MSVVVSMYIVKPDWQKSLWSDHHRLELSRVPSVNEFIDIHPSVNRPNDDWYKVVMVVHCSSEPEYGAHIFVEPVDYHEAFPQR